MVITQPITQVRLTNIAVVRYFGAKRARFELACYPNKVQDWRSGLEADISEVLQTDRVFTNVSKGKVAPDDELMKEFNTTSLHEISRVILNKGIIQYGERERKLQAAEFYKEVCHLAAPRLISKSTGAALTADMVEGCMKRIRYRPKFTPGANAKVAALALAKKLRAKMPEEIILAKMLGEIICKVGDESDRVEAFLTKELEDSQMDEKCVNAAEGTVTITYHGLPRDWGKVEEFVKAHLGKNTSFRLVRMYDEFTPVTQPEAGVAAGVEAVDDDSCSSSAYSSDYESDDSLAGSRVQEPMYEHRKGLKGFDALMSDEEEEADNDGGSLSEAAKASKEREQSDRGAQESSEGEDEEDEDDEEDNGDRMGKTVDMDTVEDRRSRRRRVKESIRKEISRERKKEEKRRKGEVKKLMTNLQQSGMNGESVEAGGGRPAGSDSKSWCLVCEVDWALLSQSLHSHYKSEWHEFNQKRRVRDLAPVSMAEFESLARDVRDGFLAVQF